MSHSVGTVLYENESHFVHLITSQYECVVNWRTAQCLRVTVPLVLFHTWLPENQIFGGWATLNEKIFPGEDPRTPRPHPSTTTKEGGWYATVYHVQTLQTLLKTIDTHFWGHREGTQQKQCADKLQNQHMTSWTKRDTKTNPTISLSWPQTICLLCSLLLPSFPVHNSWCAEVDIKKIINKTTKKKN